RNLVTSGNEADEARDRQECHPRDEQERVGQGGPPSDRAGRRREHSTHQSTGSGVDEEDAAQESRRAKDRHRKLLLCSSPAGRRPMNAGSVLSRAASITPGVIGERTVARYSSRHEHADAARRTPPSRMAPSPPPEPARSGAGGGDLSTAPQFRRIRPVDAEPRDAASPGGAARHPASRAERSA